MKTTVKELEDMVEAHAREFGKIPDYEFSQKPIPSKWSKKEVLGHLIDSAQNNIRRFLVSQYETTPSKIIYEQDFWVTASDYQHAKKEELILLWKLINHQIIRILSKMPAEGYVRQSDTGKEAVQLHSVKFLSEDYVKHMKHHINQIIPGSYDIVYT